MDSVYRIHKELEEQALLYYPNLNETFYINTDACNNGIGAVFYQTDGIIGYFSKKLSENQTKYSTSEKEVLSILLAIQYWTSWIEASKIIVHIDGKNVVGETVNLYKKVAKRIVLLAEYDIEYVHITGRENVVADELS